VAKIEDFALHQRVRRYRKMAGKARALAAEFQYDRSDFFLEVADKWDRLAKLTEAVIQG
jgi:type I restriction-modification system DNA methylase subunit